MRRQYLSGHPIQGDQGRASSEEVARVLADGFHDVVLATTSTLDPAAIESNCRLTVFPPGR